MMAITSIASLVPVALLLYVLARPWPGNLIEAGILAVFLLTLTGSAALVARGRRAHKE